METERAPEPGAELDPWLTRLSLGYLGLPVLLFLALWLRPAFAVPAVLLTLAGLVGLGRSMPPTTASLGSDARKTLLACAVVALVATCFSGAGGVGLQNWDYDKHNAVLHDLIDQPIPVRYADQGDPALAGPLVYYLGWYMPAALVGRVLGWGAANAALFAWTFLGIGLALGWFTRLCRARGWLPPLFLLFFSGMDVVGVLLSGRNPFGMTNLEMHHWMWFAQYTHNLAVVDWVPHHGIAMWLGTSLVLYETLIRRRRDTLLGPWALLPFWSPWALVGIAPLALVGALRSRGRLVGWASVAVVAGSMPFVMAFLASNRGNVVRGWAWSSMGRLQFAGAYFAFVVVEFALVAFLVWRILRPQGTERTLLAVTVAGLFLLPLYRFGISSDLTMRASLPLLFVLAVFAYRAAATGTGRARQALLLVLGIGALSPLHEAVYSTLHYRLGPPDPATVRPLPFTDGRGYAKQFVGDERKPFWRLLAR
jgi:hypothetical protein